MDASKINGNIDDDAPVHSVRIRVGRSIDGFGLSPGITQEQRLAVESLMKNAFTKLTGDLEGTYHPLTGMKENVRQQLVDDHFLFMSGDPNLKAAGMERDWPEGRGIFHNADKSFLVWVNEEDQLRIISMDVLGGDVTGVFERLARGVKAVGDSVKVESGKEFSLDPRYGYIHSCPTNLGTGMRASVHIDLPGWTQEGQDALMKRCEELKLQPRGTKGESGGATGITYDISNKHRLGYSEVELVQTMIDGVNLLFKEDIGHQKLYKIYPYMPEIKSKDSLVAKFVTPSIWKKMGDKKTATTGWTLAKACACSFKFADQGVGIYAGDADCYTDFATVFDPIIQEYHGIEAKAMHTSDLTLSKIKGNIIKGIPVQSVRIRVGRNIEGYGLSPGITRDHRLEVENSISNGLTKLTGFLAGTYHTLRSINEETKAQLKKDGFVFMSGTPSAKISGMDRDMPEGRGIFHNEDKTFRVWVNEEDHLRIVFVENSSDIRGAFEHLVTAITSVEASIGGDSAEKKFMCDPKYGYIHTCPSNLGTGMRITVRVDSPGWAAHGFDLLTERCNDFSVDCKRVLTETGSTDGTLFDISNKHRLGWSEVELINMMIAAINKIGIEDTVLQLKYRIADIEPFPEIKSVNSLVAKYVPKKVWDRLAAHKTKTSGFTLSQAINCAVQFDNQNCGIYAGDWDSYKDFADVFDPIIQEYHGIDASTTHTSNMDISKIKGNINDGIPVHSVRIRVGRSIDGYGLSPGITQEQRLAVETMMKNAFTKLQGDLAGTYYPLADMDEAVHKQLVDDHFLFMSGDPNLEAAGMERDWPEGRGIFHNEAKTFLVWVNEEDQLRIISMEKGGNVKGVFERLASGVRAVGDSVYAECGQEFALDAKYGYIHSCPTNLGTGMRASVHVDLPGWGKEGMEALQKRCEELKVQPRGTRGESGGQTGNTFDISNKHRLGYSEVELVQCMIDGVNTLHAEDLELQKKHGAGA
ncbi:unnamed protein product [Meganyctiphanes norvegica]|uniref:arginine kinase n=1 Tax=Meganyctiphanes norvegica TaxID=48144 RepID=A0AAV2REF8_MEGNR